jgi:hypothetical protein
MLYRRKEEHNIQMHNQSERDVAGAADTALQMMRRLLWSGARNYAKLPNAFG